MKLLERIVKFTGNFFALLTILAAVLGVFNPTLFKWVLPQIPLLLGIIMFGMGMTLKLEDFKIILKRPKDVFIGTLLQFTIMPLAAFAISYIFNLSPELAVGVVLVGTCPGGTASNVMAYLAKGDVALSVAMTTVSTFLAPILTPFLTLQLAGKWIPVNATAMFISIAKIVLIPIVLGVIANKLFGKKVQTAVKVLPLISVVSIVLIVGGVVGVNSERIMSTGGVVFAVVILHNCLGLLVGYFSAGKLKLSEGKRRSVAIEVGMQNSGLAVSLAMIHFSPAAAIPAAIFSVWHNISGPILATYWSRKQENLNEHLAVE